MDTSTRVTRLWTQIRYPLSGILGWTGTVIGIVAGIATFLSVVFATDTARELIWSLALAAIAIIAFSVLVYQNVRRSKAESFFSKIGDIAQAAEIERNLYSYLVKLLETKFQKREISKKEIAAIHHNFRHILTVYAQIFSQTSGSRCRLCIKILRTKTDTGETNPPKIEDMYVYCLARDFQSAEENKIHDEKRKAEYLDALADNSDFLALWDQETVSDNIFFSNDLRKENDYASSSLNYVRNIQGNPNKNTDNNKSWPLYYVSTIVWPIRQDSVDVLGIDGTTQRGFLAVDSRMPYAFDRDSHGALGQMIASSLYPLIDLYTELLD